MTTNKTNLVELFSINKIWLFTCDSKSIILNVYTVNGEEDKSSCRQAFDIFNYLLK